MPDQPDAWNAAVVPRQITRRAFLAGAAACGLGALLAACGDELELIGTPATEQFPDTGMLVDVPWVAERVDDPRLRLIDCSDINTWRSGRVPGARHLWWQDTIEVNNPVYGMLTGPDTRRRLAREAGIDSDSDVVCYDDAGGVYAARAIWMLHTMSFTRARLLDGGRQAWRAAGHDLTRRDAGPGAGDFEGVVDEEVNAAAHDIVAWLTRPDLVILDTRSAEERETTWFDRLRRGQIPGSRWLPRERFLASPDAHVLAAPGVLAGRLSDAGVDLNAAEMIVYGLHSTLAALPWLALRALGVPHVRVYNGSWAEWGANAALPIEVLDSSV
jgi:thiosulfate/3-mercaptopyruvate sulfurtransferase